MGCFLGGALYKIWGNYDRLSQMMLTTMAESSYILFVWCLGFCIWHPSDSILSHHWSSSCGHHASSQALCHKGPRETRKFERFQMPTPLSHWVCSCQLPAAFAKKRCKHLLTTSFMQWHTCLLACFSGYTRCHWALSKCSTHFHGESTLL